VGSSAYWAAWVALGRNERTQRELASAPIENRSTIMTSNRPLEEWGKLLGGVPTAGATLDRFLHHAQTIAMTGRSYRFKDHAAIAGSNATP
jgi:DNA replication protein DnaC